jgi:hypothetical protein
LLYKDMGEYAKAEPLFKEAPQILQRVLGPEHPNTATSLNNLAELYQVMGFQSAPMIGSTYEEEPALSMGRKNKHRGSAKKQRLELAKAERRA